VDVQSSICIGKGLTEIFTNCQSFYQNPVNDSTELRIVIEQKFILRIRLLLGAGRAGRKPAVRYWDLVPFHSRSLKALPEPPSLIFHSIQLFALSDTGLLDALRRHAPSVHGRVSPRLAPLIRLHPI
jgi:hypothetical protein